MTLLVCKLASYTKDKKGVKREADNSRLVDIRFNTQRNLHTKKLSWVGQRQLHALTHLPEAYRFTEALTGFSHVLHPEGLSLRELLQGCAHQNGPTVGTRDRMYIWGEGGGWSHCPGPAHRSNYSQTTWMTSSKRFQELENQGAEQASSRF